MDSFGPARPVSGAPVSGGPSVYVSRSYPTPEPAPSPAEHPTVPGTGRRGRRRWWLGGLGMVALLAIGGLTTWYASSRPDTDPVGLRGTPEPTATLDRQPLGGCVVLPAGARCPTDLECYSAQTRPVDCAGTHTWETFALGTAPASLTTVNRQTLRADPQVSRVCGQSTFATVTLLMDPQGWTFDVLPPSAAALSAGDRTYRCLAGRGPDALNGPKLSR
jgi:eukaryotic-like serine/threonine-protein kinase